MIRPYYRIQYRVAPLRKNRSSNETPSLCVRLKKPHWRLLASHGYGTPLSYFQTPCKPGNTCKFITPPISLHPHGNLHLARSRSYRREDISRAIVNTESLPTIFAYGTQMRGSTSRRAPWKTRRIANTTYRRVFSSALQSPITAK
ncbi:hypothetical protein IG631_21091 [Alternaria alternata]|nr:hypothetical protein IG631_21091 [Alternaria alternata]